MTMAIGRRLCGHDHDKDAAGKTNMLDAKGKTKVLTSEAAKKKCISRSLASSDHR